MQIPIMSDEPISKRIRQHEHKNPQMSRGPDLPEPLRRRYVLFKNDKILGRGTCGRVYAGAMLPPASDHGPVAIKEYRDRHDDSVDYWPPTDFECETEALRLMDGTDGVVRMIEAYVDMPMRTAWMFMERMDETLASWLARSTDQVGSPTTHLMTKQLVRAVHAIHTAGLSHCDIKPSNILLRHGPGFSETLGLVVKLADFGLAQMLPVSVMASPRIVTQQYRAPNCLPGW